MAVQGGVVSAQRGAPSDVPRSHWAFAAVDGLFKDGILVGYPPDGSFKGNAKVSRDELAAAIARLAAKAGGR